MAVKYYFLGGFSVHDKISTQKGLWIRKDLVSVPRILEYRLTTSPNLKVYVNSMGSAVVVADYGEFENGEQMLVDYYVDKTIYQQKYTALLKSINDVFGLSLSEVDWVMPICKLNLIINISEVAIADELFEENREFVALIDCSIIYQSCQFISTFFKSLSDKKGLSRFEQYQISFYMQELQVLSDPVFFLTSKKEIELYKKFYETWELGKQIDIVLVLAEKSIHVFVTLSEFKDKNSKDILNVLLSYVSFVFAHEPISGLVHILFPSMAVKAEDLLRLLLLSGTIVFIVILLKSVISFVKDNLEYRNKTK